MQFYPFIGGFGKSVNFWGWGTERFGQSDSRQSVGGKRAF